MGAYYALLLGQLRSATLAKHRGKISHRVLFLHDNAPVHKSEIVQAAIRQANFTELNCPAFSSGIAPTDHYLLSNFRKILHSMTRPSTPSRNIWVVSIFNFLLIE